VVPLWDSASGFQFEFPATYAFQDGSVGEFAADSLADRILAVRPHYRQSNYCGVRPRQDCCWSGGAQVAKNTTGMLCSRDIPRKVPRAGSHHLSPQPCSGASRQFVVLLSTTVCAPQTGRDATLIAFLYRICTYFDIAESILSLDDDGRKSLWN
jgi:hypothetical protein